MKAPIRKLTLTLLAAAGLAAGAAQAMPKPFSPLDAGMLVSTDTPDRSVEVKPGTRYVNVVNGETVSFKVGGQVFTYAFNAWNSINSIDLSAIAPKGVTVPQVRVYIAPNPSSEG